MNEKGNLKIFKTLLSRLLENFGPKFNLILTDVDKSLARDVEFDFLFQFIFSRFPRVDPQYQIMLDDLTQIAITDTEESLIFLCKTLKDVIKQKTTPFQTLKTCCVFFDTSNRSHRILFYYFQLFFLTDLICQIVAFCCDNKSPKDISSSSITNSNSASVIDGFPYNKIVDSNSISSYSSSIDGLNEQIFSPKTNEVKRSSSITSAKGEPSDSSIEAGSNDNLFGYSNSYFNLARDNTKLTSSTANLIIRTGNSATFSEQLFVSAHMLIVKQWSVIFSYLSIKHSSEISTLFTFFSNTSATDITLPMLLVRFLRFDIDDTMAMNVIGRIIQLCKALIRKKLLTNSVLESLAYMLITLPYNEDTYQKLYSLATSTLIRKDKSLSSGRMILLMNLFLRYSKLFSKFSSFFHKKVVASASNKEKLELSLRCFRLILMGRNVKPECLFWEWGHNPNATPLSFIQFISVFEKKHEHSFINLFMEQYFTKSDFSVCPEEFTNTIMHLASLEFSLFMTIITPRFLELDSKDSRFLVFLSVIALVNTKDFQHHSFSKIKKSGIAEFNSICRPKILKEFLCLANSADTNFIEQTSSTQTVNNQHGVCLHNFAFLLDSLSDESDRKLLGILEEWNLSDQFEMLEIQHVQSIPTLKILDLTPLLLRTLKFVFTSDDFNDPRIISILIDLSCHIENRIASAAYNICETHLPHFIDPNLFITMAVRMKYINDPEAAFVIYSLVYSIMKNTFGKTAISNELLSKIEFSGLMLLISVFPSTRDLGQAILYQCAKRNKSNNLLSYILPKMDYIEKTVKIKMFIHSSQNKLEIEFPPANNINYSTALISHYYDVWLFFLSEILNCLIASNYLPLFQFLDSTRKVLIEQCLKYNTKPSSIAVFLVYLSTMFHVPTLLASPSLPKTTRYKEFNTESEDHRKEVCSIIHSLIQNENERLVDIGFNLIEHLHYSLQPTLIDVLSLVEGKKLIKATRKVSLLLRMPEVQWPFYKHHLIRLISFIKSVQYYLLKLELNSTRLIQWTDKMEEYVSVYSDFIIDYCTIIFMSFKKLQEGLSNNIWPLSSREITVRFLINWSTTKMEKLAKIRFYAAGALVSITSLGPFFNDASSLDLQIFELFGLMESNGLAILYNLLHFHLDFLLDHFIDSCYTLPRQFSDLYFNAIIQVICRNESNLIYIMSGELIFLSCVYLYENHMWAKKMVEALRKGRELSSYIKFNESPTLENQPKTFQFAVEAVFGSFFRVLKLKDRHITTNDIIESIRPWISSIRLLPKLKTCSPVVPPLLNMYTPYEFLNAMIEVTEYVDDDQFRLVMSLWVDLWNQPDHAELVPLYLSELRDYKSKTRIFEVLLESTSMNLPINIASHCSFAYYYHITENLGRSFDEEQKFLGQLLSKAFSRNWAFMNPQLIKVIHFAFLFGQSGWENLFHIICRKMKIESFNGKIPHLIMRKLVDQFIEKLTQEHFSIEEWGNQALSWILGCKQLNLVTISLIIYNRIMKPFDRQVLYLIIRCVSYHLANNSENDLNDFISECFYFITKNYEIDKDVCIKFMSAFLDCSYFINSGILVETSTFFLRAIQNKEIVDTSMIISILRPRMTILETNDTSQIFLNDLINLVHTDELEMIALPFKAIATSVFTSLEPFTVDEIIDKCSDSSLCKALVHYSIIITNASYHVQNQIFYITDRIIRRLDIKYENNKISLAKIYNQATRNLARCDNAMSFIRSICIIMPDIAVMNVLQLYEYNRTIEDVDRILKILVNDIFNKDKENIAVTITDCGSYKQVENFLFSDVKPKILPFATNFEIIDGMRRITRNSERSKKTSNNRKKIRYDGSLMLNSLSVVFTDLPDETDTCIFTPLFHPNRLILDNLYPIESISNSLRFKEKDFSFSMS